MVEGEKGEEKTKEMMAEEIRRDDCEELPTNHSTKEPPLDDGMYYVSY